MKMLQKPEKPFGLFHHFFPLTKFNHHPKTVKPPQIFQRFMQSFAANSSKKMTHFENYINAWDTVIGIRSEKHECCCKK